MCSHNRAAPLGLATRLVSANPGRRYARPWAHIGLTLWAEKLPPGCHWLGQCSSIQVRVVRAEKAAIYAFKEITSPYWLNEKRLRDQKIAMIGDKISQAARLKTGK